MGKRELLIAGAFVVVAAVAYHLTASAPRAGERGFSIGAMFAGLRDEIASDSARAEFNQAGTFAVPADVEVLRIGASRSVPVTIEGEDRRDIAFEMPVRSTGPDPASALDFAKRSVVEFDDLGRVLNIGTYFPTEGSQTATLLLKVPARLAVRIETGARPKVTGVAAVFLGRVSGEAVVEGVRGTVTGTHLNGDVTVRATGSVDLILINSRARFAGIERGLVLNARGGECEIEGSRGPIAFASTSARLMIRDHDGPIEIGGEGGHLRLDRPRREVRIDIRRAPVDITLAAAAPVTVIGSDEPLRLTLDGPPPVALDAWASQRSIEAVELGLDVERSERGARLTHRFGAATARVVLRNARGDIVIARAK